MEIRQGILGEKCSFSNHFCWKLSPNLSRRASLWAKAGFLGWGLGSAQKCSGACAQSVSRYIYTRPYWLPLPFDQARRGFYDLRRLTAWARWQLCHEENNNQKQMHGIFTNMSATTMHVSGVHPHRNTHKKKRKRKNIYFHKANFHAKPSICLAFVFGINRTRTHSKIMSKVQRVEGWEVSRG